MNNITAEEFQALCAEQGWLTHATKEQADKIVWMIQGGTSYQSLALAVWMCTQGVSESKIEDILENRFWDRGRKDDPSLKKISVSVHPYCNQSGDIYVPADMQVNDEQEEILPDCEEYIRDHWDDILFSEPDIDSRGTDFEAYDENE